jgi:hypothetical protein
MVLSKVVEHLMMMSGSCGATIKMGIPRQSG